MSSSEIPPIRRSISVSWSPVNAFRRFTEEFGSWWPSRTHSIGGQRVMQLVFEQRLGGRIYEEHADGRRFQWGEVTLWDPPARVRFTWHPARDPSSSQNVAIEFKAEGTGTRLELTSTGWERWGRGAQRARKAYRVGWGYVLNVWAGHRTVGMLALEVVTGLVNFSMKIRGGREAEIARAGGEITTT